MLLLQAEVYSVSYFFNSSKKLKLTNAAAFAGNAWGCALEIAEDEEEAGHTP